MEVHIWIFISLILGWTVEGLWRNRSVQIKSYTFGKKTKYFALESVPSWIRI